MQTQTIENTVNKLYKLPPVQLENAMRYIDELFKVSVQNDKQAMLNQLMGSMQGIEIDDPKKEYHQHLDEKYAEYFIESKTNEPQDFMSSWQKRHEENKDFLDNDSSWADVRDKEMTKEERQAQFLAWRAYHEKELQSLDEEWDEDWADVRDKNDFGREFSWDI